MQHWVGICTCIYVYTWITICLSPWPILDAIVDTNCRCWLLPNCECELVRTRSCAIFSRHVGLAVLCDQSARVFIHTHISYILYIHLIGALLHHLSHTWFVNRARHWTSHWERKLFKKKTCIYLIWGYLYKYQDSVVYSLCYTFVMRTFSIY